MPWRGIRDDIRRYLQAYGEVEKREVVEYLVKKWSLNRMEAHKNINNLIKRGEIEREGERIRLKEWKEKEVDRLWRAMRYLQWFAISDLVQLGFKAGTVRYMVYVLWQKGDLVRQRVGEKYKYRVVSEERGRLTYDELKKKEECGRD